MANQKTDNKQAPVVGQPNMDDEMLPPSTAAKPASAPAVTQTLTLTATDLAAIVHEATSAATTAATSSNSQVIADAISRALTQHMGPRRMSIADIGEPKTPFNPTGRKRELKHEFFQNFAPIYERFVSDDEIDLLHKLVPGNYGTPDLPIAVVEKRRLDGGKSRIFIIHPDSKDARLAMKNYAPNFHAMLVKLVQEAKDQRAQRRAEARALLASEE